MTELFETFSTTKNSADHELYSEQNFSLSNYFLQVPNKHFETFVPAKVFRLRHDKEFEKHRAFFIREKMSSSGRQD